MEELDFAGCACAGGTLQRFVQPVIMGLLAHGAQHGYALLQGLRALPLWEGAVPDQTGVYRLLKSMEARGLLTAAEEAGLTTGRRRYALTERGRACLAQWETTLEDYRRTLDATLMLVREANHMDRAFTQLVERVAREALAGRIPVAADLEALLEVPADSAEAAFLGRRARDMARQTAKNHGRVWSAIGVDCRPCPMNCGFCSFGEKWGLVRAPQEWSAPRIVETARRFVAQGAYWVTLRTTEFYSLEKLLDLVRRLRREVPGSYRVVVNTGELEAADARALAAAGGNAVYHTLRLGDGEPPGFTSATRLDTLGTVRGSSLDLAHLVEPVGPEHGNKELVAVLLTALRYEARLCGVMARINVPGTPCGDRAGTGPDAELSPQRLAQIAAVTRLAGGVRTPDICVHPPTLQALNWGANVLVVETGAVPRDVAESDTDWRAFGVEDALSLLLEAGYALGGD